MQMGVSPDGDLFTFLEVSQSIITWKRVDLVKLWAFLLKSFLSISIDRSRDGSGFDQRSNIVGVAKLSAYWAGLWWLGNDLSVVMKSLVLMTLWKISMLMSKIAKKLRFFSKKLTKIVIFLNKIAIGNFVEKNVNFCQFFWKKCQSFGQFFDSQMAIFRRVR